MATCGLRYNDYDANIQTGLKSILTTSEMSDITLAVEGKILKAHQLILSIFSPYFRELFSENHTKQTIFFMKNVKYHIMRHLLLFMYEGKVDIAKEDLNLFVETANELKIKGLSFERYSSLDNISSGVKRPLAIEDIHQEESAKKSKDNTEPAVSHTQQSPVVNTTPTIQNTAMQMTPGVFVLPYAMPSTSWLPNAAAGQQVQQGLPYIPNVASHGQPINEPPAGVNDPQAGGDRVDDDEVVVVETPIAVQDLCGDDDDEEAMCDIKVEEPKIMCGADEKLLIPPEGASDSLAKARSKAENETLSTTEDEDLGRGKRAHHTQIDSSDTEDNLSDSMPIFPKLTRRHHQPHDPLTAVSVTDIIKAPAVFDDILNTSTTPAVSSIFSTVSSDEINNLATKIAELKEICLSSLLLIKDIDSRLNKVENNMASNIQQVIHQHASTVDEDFLVLPINTFEDLAMIEEKLQNQELVDKFTILLKRIGGRNSKENITRCLKTVYTDKLMVSCSWLGHRNNYKMCDLKSIATIKQVIISSFNDLKMNEFEKITSEWIRLSRLRMVREEKGATRALNN